ncbi:MAG: amylo-alpha-1,6-glucosidase [Symploca sp. SIO3C6]|uniref:Amylo-alpha-1,6-glucosidase n=1 Tax=Symploca sp. SIO1C4 TaxID=2607765 RepID=A0A6B3NBG7_9CYAN|nr:amylo-alpha-1,6-glucosidase [Symploca sp. SIO3C6]NER26991.1 amylo-alpha-1,6-glucosidase [Symploca sp. SIO1C4]NET06378.1 amylo-alpha-1,6-glucosidase [Symploca sp. SIO2B6]
MNDLDTREWLITNGLGSFASGTVCGARTRTYHGWLIAALEPPVQRTLLLSHLDASLEVEGTNWAISTNFWNGGKKIEPLGYQLLRSFEAEPIPKWVWGFKDWQLTQQMVMPYGLSEGWLECDHPKQPQLCSRILIEYQYQGSKVATLRLRPLIGDRDFHHQQLKEHDLNFSQLVGNKQIYLQGICNGKVGVPWLLRWSRGDYQVEGVWYWNYYYPEEHRRGLPDREDLYSPGYLSVILHPGETITLEARVGLEQLPLPGLNSGLFEQAVQTEQQRQKQLWASVPSLINSEKQSIWRQLLRAADQFIAYRSSISGPTVIAGYPWFNDWGRDTLIALPGLTLATGRYTLAKGLLETFGSYCRDGLIPNTFPNGNAEPIYNSIDASLWWIEILGLYLETTQDWSFLNKQYPVVRKIYKALTAGILYQIRVDANDGLLTWDAPNVALTWMDAVINGHPVTPRRGKPVEINALWYSALCWISKWTARQAQQEQAEQVRLLQQAKHYEQQAQRVKVSLQKFWNPERRYFYDTIEPDGHRDPRIRPNAVIALSLYHCGFVEDNAKQVLQVARERLLTPYGLRSLDPAEAEYMGFYSGNRWHRDIAYHQGTVWSWLIGPFIRAWKRFYRREPLPCNFKLLLAHFQQEACLGSISEIFDGDTPHCPQGAIAQAWSVAEIIRHFSDF